MIRWLVLGLLGAASVAPLPAQSRPAARRPAPAATTAARGALAADLMSYLDASWAGGGTWGGLVVSLSRGDTLFALNADRKFIPASNAKLFSTAAALHYLGSDYRFVTVLYADGRVRNGELLGDLVLYGTGDPSFVLDQASLSQFADSVVHAGIRRVRGDLIGDASFLGADLRAPGWVPDNLTSSYSARPQALGANNNRIRVTVEPGARAGTPARVTLDPDNDYFAVSSVVLTGSRTRIRMQRGRERGVIQLSGTIAGGDVWDRDVVVDEPATFAAHVLRRLLEQRGVRIDGSTRSVVDDAPTRAHTMLARSASRGDAFAGAVAVHRSPPLGDVVSMINHRSHNLSAELAFRAIGRMQGGTGTFASGTRAVARFLVDDVGIPRRDVAVADGSGLSLLDLATPRSLVQLLTYMRTSAEGAAFYESLPLVGVGMRSRMTTTAAAGRLRAKTGTLSGVSALSGYVTTADGEELAFALVVNRTRSIDASREAQDSVGVRLASFARTVAEARSGN